MRGTLAQPPRSPAVITRLHKASWPPSTRLKRPSAREGIAGITYLMSPRPMTPETIRKAATM
jgi:hypothetical protein